MGEERRIQGLVVKPEGRKRLEVLGVDGKTVLKWTLKKWY